MLFLFCASSLYPARQQLLGYWYRQSEFFTKEISHNLQHGLTIFDDHPILPVASIGTSLQDSSLISESGHG
jgi:hypothetical protein